MEWCGATRLRRDRFAQLRFTGGSPLDPHSSAQRLRHHAAAPTTCEIENRLPEILITRNPETPKPRKNYLRGRLRSS
jgi:hypothetical protein